MSGLMIHVYIVLSPSFHFYPYNHNLLQASRTLTVYGYAYVEKKLYESPLWKTDLRPGSFQT